jgi:hypothetical protein
VKSAFLLVKRGELRKDYVLKIKVFKMIDIFNEGKGNMESFQSYDALLKHIKAIEKRKFVETGQEDWIFTIHSHERLAGFYWNAVKAISILLTEKEQDAYENGLNLLEMCKGDQNNSIQIILTPDIDVNEIIKNWCRDYCLNHGYIFLGTKQ